MHKNVNKLITGHVVRDSQKIPLEELCNSCSISVEEIKVMVEHGIIKPIQFQTDIHRWAFNGKCVLRIKTVIRLQRDLGVNMAGAALAVELLDEIKKLRQIKSIVDV